MKSRTNGIVFGRGLRIPASALTLNGFRRWVHSPRFPKRVAASFIDGDVHIDVSREELMTHNAVHGDLTGCLGQYLQRDDLGRLFVRGALLINEAANLAVEPDFNFCRWETFEAGKLKLVEFKPGSGEFDELHGSPDLVVEVVSDSSATRDTMALRSSYHRAGIPEYWIIDARGDAVEFHVLRWQPGDYVEATIDSTGNPWSQALDASVSLTRELNHMSFWRYTLHIA